MMNNIFDTIRDAVNGKNDYNLEIRIDKKIENSCCSEDLEKIRQYGGNFIVSSYGYLRKGKDEMIYQNRSASIKNSNFLKTGVIHFDNGEIDIIIDDFFGLRLLQTKYRREREVLSSLRRLVFV